MTDRDRLIELIKQAKTEIAFFTSDGELVTKSERHIVDRSEVKDLAEHLLANGVIVPPCKVGDMVYEINLNYPKAPFISRFIVVAFHITSGKNILGHKKPSHAVVGVDYMPSLTKRIYLDNFGKTVFLTKEEAEEKLKEWKGNADKLD